MDLLRDRESLNRSLIRPGAQSGAVVFGILLQESESGFVLALC